MRSARRSLIIFVLTLVASSAFAIVPAPFAEASHAGGCFSVVAAPDLTSKAAYGIALDDVNGNAFVAIEGAGRVDVISSSTNAKINGIPVPSTDPNFLAVDHAADRLYVGDFGADSVYVIDISSETLVTTLTVESPQSMVLNRTTKRLYVAGQTNSVAVFNTMTNASAGLLNVGGHSLGLDVDLAGNRVVVADYTNNTLDIFSGADNGLIDSFALGGTQPITVRYDPLTGNAWVSLRTSGAVVQIDPDDGDFGPSVTLAGAQGLDINPAFDLGYASPNNASTLTMFRLSTGNVLDTFAVGAEPLVIEARDNPPAIYAAGYADGTVTVIKPSLLAPFTDVTGGNPFCFDIEWLVDQNITGGFADGTFRPTSTVTRQSMAAFLYRYAGEPPFPDPAVAAFTDVPTTHPFFTEIEWLVDQGIASGFADGGYHPTASVTRQSMAAFLYRLAGEPAFVTPLTPTFSDVGLAHPFFLEIEWLAAMGIAGGFSDGGYHPSSTVSRQAMAAFLHRYSLLK